MTEGARGREGGREREGEKEPSTRNRDADVPISGLKIKWIGIWMDGLDGGAWLENVVAEAPSRSRLTSRLDIVIRHLRAIRHLRYVRMHARVERHLYISDSTYLAAIRSRRAGIINLVSISWPGQTCSCTTYQPNLYPRLRMLCSYSPYGANIVIVSIRWTVVRAYSR